MAHPHNGHPSRRSRAGRGAVALVTALGLMGVSAGPAAAEVAGTDNANQLAQALSVGPVTSAALDGPPVDPDPSFAVYPSGIGDSALAGFPLAGPTFTVLTSGDAELADDPNDDTGSTGFNEPYNNPSRGNANDPTTLAVTVNVPGGANCLAFDYRFLSEEFPEYVNAGFNDAFLAELDASNWSVADDNTISAPGDFAAPAGDRVSVDSVGPTAVTEVNAAGTTYDAATNVLTTKHPAAPGAHTLFLSIFDNGDYILDSAVFVDNLRFSNEPPQDCKPPDLFGGQLGLDPASKAKVKNGKALVPVACGLEVGITVNCEGVVELLASKQALAKKPKKIGKKAFSIPPSTSADVKVKLKASAKRALKKKGKLKVKNQLTNSSNGVSQTFKLKLKG